MNLPPVLSSCLDRVARAAGRMVDDAREFRDSTCPGQTHAAWGAGAARQLEQAARTLDAEVIRGTGRSTEEHLGIGAGHAKWLFGVLVSDEGRGVSIGADNFETPWRFGYGEKKSTLLGGELVARNERPPETKRGTRTELTDEFGAKARLFGSASAKELAASIGAEYEFGGRSFGRETRGDRTGEGEFFVGHRGRAFAEAGLFGASIGAESMVGLSQYVHETGDAVGPLGMTYGHRTQWTVGLAGSMYAAVGLTGASARAHLELGWRVRSELFASVPIYKGTAALLKQNLNFFAGAETGAELGANPAGVSAGLNAFVGARATWRPELGFTFNDVELAGVFAKLEGRVGLGLTVNVKYGWDPETRSLRGEGEAGAALGVGASFGGGVVFCGNDIDKAFGEQVRSFL